MKFFEKSHPTYRNRACIIHSELKLTFLHKVQCDEFVKELMMTEEYPNFSVDTNCGDSLTMTEYVVTLHDIPWAKNLKWIAELAEKYDYNDE